MEMTTQEMTLACALFAQTPEEHGRLLASITGAYLSCELADVKAFKFSALL
jgi:hypothetical protein